MEMAYGLHTALGAVDRHVNSARPDAPVVPHVERPRRAYSIRKALVGRLRRAPAAHGPACQPQPCQPQPC